MTRSRVISAHLRCVKRSKGLRRTSMIRKKAIRKRSPRKKMEADVYEVIWRKRPHQCEVCEAPIESPRPENFSHLLPKGSYSNYKRDERNIRIQCKGCHDMWHDQGPEKLKSVHRWVVTCTLYFHLRDESNGLL